LGNSVISDRFNYPEDLQDTLQTLITGAFENYGPNPLIILDQDGSTFRYRDAGAITIAVCNTLLAKGVKRGDLICSYATIHPESIILFWACSLLGIIYVPLDHNWPEILIRKITEKVQPGLFFCDKAREPELIKAKTGLPVVVYDNMTNYEGKAKNISFSEWVEDRYELSGLPEVHPNDTAVVLFTSGTTSEPKGVMLSQGALVRSGWLVKEAFGFKENDILYSIGELNAMSGLRNPCIATLHAGSSFVITSEDSRSNVISIAETVKDHGCTLMSTAPAVIRLLIQFRQRLPNHSLKTLRHVVSTGSELKEQLIKDFEAQFQVRLINYYGLTETCGLCIGVTVFHDGSGHEGTIGVAVGAIAQVVDEQGEVVENGKPGELRVQSQNLMQGYYKNPGLTANVLRDGWFYTGDLAIIREDGHIVLIGRKSDIIKDVHAALIHPGEIESVLEMHEGVKEAGVCGYVAPGGEERIAAFIIPEKKPIDRDKFFKELNQWVERNLGQRKRVSRFVLKETLPKSGNNKLLRRKLTEEIENG
jgi:acyl-coenzyme A synthetase/AMP-(fatty) acid ligase